MEFSPGIELACYHNEKLFSTLDMFDVHSSQWTHWDIGLNSCGLMSLKMSTEILLRCLYCAHYACLLLVSWRLCDPQLFSDLLEFELRCMLCKYLVCWSGHPHSPQLSAVAKYAQVEMNSRFEIISREICDTLLSPSSETVQRRV